MDLITDSHLVEQFRNLFRGGENAHGRYNPVTNKCVTQKETATFTDFQKHLTGEMGIGIVPITHTHECYFAVLDFDQHGKDPNTGLPMEIDLVRLSATVRDRGLPLVVCRSKRGGAHCILFGEEPLNGETVRRVLTAWKRELRGHGEDTKGAGQGIEIFPKKATHLRGEIGNWINLPYFNAADTNRYAIRDGEILTLEEFLHFAEEMKVRNSDLLKYSSIDDQAPPCIQKMCEKGIPEGQRNIALYNYCVMAKQAYPDDWTARAFDFNARYMDIPMPHEEAEAVIKSVSKDTKYRYKCKEEPCKTYCNAKVCLTRTYGITPEDELELVQSKTHQLGPLYKIETEPVLWELCVDGVPVRVQTASLLSFPKFIVAAMEQLTVMLNIPEYKKPARWSALINQLMIDVRHIDVPYEATTTGNVRSLLQEFLSRASKPDAAYATKHGEDDSRFRHRMALVNGMPILEKHMRTGKWIYCFRGKDFIKYLRNARNMAIKSESDVWLRIKDLKGFKRSRVAVPKGPDIDVWTLNQDAFDEDGILDPLKIAGMTAKMFPVEEEVF